MTDLVFDFERCDELCVGTGVPYDMSFDWNADVMGDRYRGWSINGEYWTEVSFDGTQEFKIKGNLTSP